MECPAPDPHGFVQQLRCRPSGRAHYVDWGNNHPGILAALNIDPVVAAEPRGAVAYARAVGKDIVEGGWFYRDSGQQFRTDSQGHRHYAGGAIAGVDDLRACPSAPLDTQFARLDASIALARGAGLGVRVDIASFFTEVYLGMGYERFFLALYDDPDFVAYYLDWALDYYLELAQRLVRSPLTAVLIDSDLCDRNGPMVAPAVLEDLWLPRMERMLAPFHAAGIPVIMHCDGRLAPVLDYFVALGVAAVHPIEPTCNDIYRLHADYAGRLCLIGNIDMERLLIRGTPDAVAADVCVHLDRLGSAGYLVSPSTSYFAPPVRVDNFRALVETVHAHRF